MTDTTDKLTIQADSGSVPKATSDLQDLGKAYDGVSVASQNTEKSTVSVESKFASLEKRFGTASGQAAQFASINKTVQEAVSQNANLQDRANEVLEAAATKYGQARSSAGSFGSVIDAGRGALLGYAAGIGPIGALLGSFGPWGIAAAGGIGLVSTALNYLNEKSNEIGDASTTLQRFANETGLSTSQIRGLNEAGSQLGISSDQVGSSIERLTVNLAEARQGTGTLYDQLRVIDGQLADNVSSTHSSAEALDLLARAYNSTTDATTKASIARAAFGRAGTSSGGILGTVGDAGGIDAYSASVTKALGVTDEWTKHVAELRNENKNLEEDLKLVNASVYTEATLARQNQYLKTQLAIAQAVTQAAKSDNGRGGISAALGFGAPTTDEFGQPFNFAQNGSGAAASTEATAVIDAQKAATQGLAQANIDNLNASLKMAAGAAAVVTAMGSGATAAEKEFARIGALTVQFEQGKISAETYSAALNTDTSRAAAQITAVSKSWGDVTESTAVALETSRNQLPVLQAVGGAAKIAAQEAADYSNYLLQGKTAAEALALAQANTAARQAQVTSGAKEQLAALQDNYAVSAATTVQQGILAQGQATYNALIRQGVDSTTAMAVASQQIADAQAKVYVQMQSVVRASQQNLDLVIAQQNGNEALVKSQIAYDNAIQQGATASQAAAIAQNTLAAASIQAANAAQQQAQAFEDAARAAHDAQFVDFTPGGDNAFGEFQTKSGVEGNSALTNIGAGLKSIADRLSAQFSGGGAGLANQILSNGGNLNSALASLQRFDLSGNNSYGKVLSAQFGVDPKLFATPDASSVFQTVDQIYQLKNARTNDNSVKSANLQEELAWLQRQPETLARDQAIQQLIESMKSLTNSTDSLNATQQASLNPLYSGRGALAVGYYKAAAGLDTVLTGGTPGVDSVPIHILGMPGERVTVTPPGQSSASSSGNDNSRSVVNHNTFVFNSSQPTSRRSARQLAQGFGQLMAAAS